MMDGATIPVRLTPEQLEAVAGTITEAVARWKLAEDHPLSEALRVLNIALLAYKLSQGEHA